MSAISNNSPKTPKKSKLLMVESRSRSGKSSGDVSMNKRLRSSSAEKTSKKIRTHCSVSSKPSSQIPISSLKVGSTNDLNNEANHKRDSVNNSKRIESSSSSSNIHSQRSSTSSHRSSSSTTRVSKSAQSHSKKSKHSNHNSDLSSSIKHKSKHRGDSDKKRNQISPSKTNKRKPHSNQTSKITKWLTQEPIDEKTDKRSHKSKLPQLDITINKSKKSSQNFQKYGVIVPSYEEILADHKKFEAHKKSVKRLEAFDNDVVDLQFSVSALTEEERFSGEILDCKKLNLVEINEYFEKYAGTLQEISDGKTFSMRHQRFEVDKELTYSTSTIVFSQEQKERIMDLMEKKFDPEDKLTNYFFKVLLPEFCLLVFMDVHNMTKQQANNYLDQRPVEAV